MRFKNQFSKWFSFLQIKEEGGGQMEQSAGEPRLDLSKRDRQNREQRTEQAINHSHRGTITVQFSWLSACKLHYCALLLLLLTTNTGGGSQKMKVSSHRWQCVGIWGIWGGGSSKKAIGTIHSQMQSQFSRDRRLHCTAQCGYISWRGGRRRRWQRNK